MEGIAKLIKGVGLLLQGANRRGGAGQEHATTTTRWFGV